MTEQLATDPTEGTPVPDAEVASEAEALDITEDVEAKELETADDGGLEESTELPAEPETVEIEVDGQKYSVPAALKDGFLRQADYTAKTTEVAEQRKALESQQQELAQKAERQQEHLQDYGQLAHVSGLLEQFDKLDWSTLERDDPDQSLQLDRQHRTLLRQREQIVERLKTREHEARVQAERESASRRDQLAATLARDIPNFSPSLREDLISVATEVGYSREDVEAVTDPSAWKILNLARLGAEVLKRQQSAQTPPKPQPVKPVPKAGGKGVAKPGLHDDLPIDEWIKRRAKQRAKSA